MRAIGRALIVSLHIAAAIPADAAVLTLADATDPSLIKFHCVGIDSLVFAGSGGVDAGFGGIGTNFAIDNFTFSRPTAVPEVSSIVLVVSGRRRGMCFTAAQSPHRRGHRM